MSASKLFLLAALVGVCSSFVVQKQDEYCVVQWWPRQCEPVSNDNCIYGQYFNSMAACGDVDDGEDSDGWCVTSWSPKTCDRVSSGDCSGWYPPPNGHASENECLGVDDDIDSDDWCVSSWWPLECAQYGSGNCIYTESLYDTKFDCDGLGDDSYWCETAWWPLACEENTGGNCLTGSGQYDSMADCMKTDSPTPTPTPGTVFCVTAWWPRNCEDVNDGNCALGSETYGSMSGCLTANGEAPAEPTPDPSNWCVVVWWPTSCENVGDGNCAPGSQYFDSQEECEGGSSDGGDYCVTSWDPKTCGLVSDGNCFGVNFDTFDDESDCMGDVPTPTPEPTPGSVWCVSQWWIRTCSNDLDDCVLGSEMYDSENDCLGVDDDKSLEVTGWCVTSFAPRTCAPVDVGQCSGWFPGPSGWETEESCMQA